MDQWMNNSSIPSPSVHPRHSCSKYLAAMQQVREAYLGEYRAKQAHLLKALSEEGTVPAAKVAEAIRKYGLKTERVNPLYA